MAAPATDTTPFPPRRAPLQDALDDAEGRTLREVDLVRTVLREALEAATASDPERAEAVTAYHAQFEQRYSEVHDRLMALIARQAPVAGDLRLAMALLHVNDRVERMAAQCLNIATLCCALRADMQPSDDQLECLAEMGRLTDEQIGEAARVFAERDIDGVKRLREHDAGINEHNRRCFALAIKDGDEEGRREVAFFVAMMARAVERIGDNAVDIGRQAMFAATGRLRAPAAG